MRKGIMFSSCLWVCVRVSVRIFFECLDIETFISGMVVQFDQNWSSLMSCLVPLFSNGSKSNVCVLFDKKSTKVLETRAGSVFWDNIPYLSTEWVDYVVEPVKFMHNIVTGARAVVGWVVCWWCAACVVVVVGRVGDGLWDGVVVAGRVGDG